jgi:D-alanyl-D-alanine carboxypeptidase (penicillin-binding protein 5/6)
VKAWGLADMHFSNPSGLVDADNYATARGLARLARLDLTNPTVKSLVNTPAATINDQAGANYSLATTNKLLNDGRFHGIKTGYTVAAGESVVSLANVNGHDVITVVLGSPDRFGETTALVNYLQGAYTWQ